MKTVYISSFLLYCVLVQGGNDFCKPHENIYKAKTTEAKPNLSYADFLENALNRGRWCDEDKACLAKLYKTIGDARNNTLYAVWMLDAMQMIPNGQLHGSALHLTNYDECMDHQWKIAHPDLNTQYCLAEVKLSESKLRKGYIPDPKGSAYVYLKTRTPNDLDLTIMRWGLCLPETCTKTTAAKIFRVLLQSSHLAMMADEAIVNIEYCEIAGEDKKNHDQDYLFIYVMVTLFAIAVWSTYLTMNHKSKSYLHEIITSFCLKRNLNALTSVYDEEIHVLNIMRIVTCLMIIMGHTIQLILSRLTVSGVRVDEGFGLHGELQRHGNLVVDTFFTLSGILVIRGFLNGSWSNPIKYLIKRYVRLYSALVLLVYVQTYVLYNMGDGPLWEWFVGTEQRICRSHAWNIFATINNYVSTDKSCLLIAWSTAVDFHMSVFAVILCVLYRMNRRLAFFMFTVMFVATHVSRYYVMHIYKLPVVLNYSLEAGNDLRQNVVYKHIYKYTHTRAGSFLVGMVMGYILSTYKPAEYRKRISRKASYLYLMACLATMMALVEVGGGHYYRNPEAAGVYLFVALNRTVFSVAICVIIVVAEYGDLGILNDFFKLSPLTTLGRLTYGVYLSHFAILIRSIGLVRTGFTVDLFTFILLAIGITALSFVISLILSLLVEAPAINIVNVLLDRPRGTMNKIKAQIDVPAGNDQISKTTSSNGKDIQENDDSEKDPY